MGVELTGRKLAGWHKIAAVITNRPYLAISDAQGQEMAEALLEVMRHYNLVVDPKTAAWINLAMTAGAIYGPMAITFIADENQRKRAPRSPVEAAVRAAGPAHPSATPTGATGEPVPDGGRIVFG